MKNTYANKPNTLQGFTSLYPYTKPSIKHYSRQPAFTIVELLIVIVVIAILAAISIAAYTNIQQRAKNTAIINAASQSLKMIEAYVAANGTYPVTWSTCVTSTTGCADTQGLVGSSATLDTNMAAIGVLPKTIPKLDGENRYGVIYSYVDTRTVNSQSQPVALLYYLQGVNQQCGMPVLNSYHGSQISTTGYTVGDSGSSGKTACVVFVPGPVHS